MSEPKFLASLREFADLNMGATLGREQVRELVIYLGQTRCAGVQIEEAYDDGAGPEMCTETVHCDGCPPWARTA